MLCRCWVYETGDRAVNLHSCRERAQISAPPVPLGSPLDAPRATRGSAKSPESTQRKKRPWLARPSLPCSLRKASLLCRPEILPHTPIWACTMLQPLQAIATQPTPVLSWVCPWNSSFITQPLPTPADSYLRGAQSGDPDHLCRSFCVLPAVSWPLHSSPILCYYSFTKFCLILCSPVDYGKPGFPVFD